MNTSAHPFAFGIFFAVLATLCWGSNFIVPYVTGNYSIFDFLAVKFMIVGVIGMVWVIVDRSHVRELTLPMRTVALTLGAIGYLGYSTCIACGVNQRPRPDFSIHRSGTSDAGSAWKRAKQDSGVAKTGIAFVHADVRPAAHHYYG